ncbi:MAG: hypothetical protein ABIZ81_02580 [Opitutaceae bacterium]
MSITPIVASFVSVMIAFALGETALVREPASTAFGDERFMAYY